MSLPHFTGSLISQGLQRADPSHGHEGEQQKDAFQRPTVQRLGLGVDMSKQLAVEQDALTGWMPRITALPLVTRMFLEPYDRFGVADFLTLSIALSRLILPIVGDH